MGDSRAVPGFGQVDLDLDLGIDEDPHITVRPAPVAPFGHVDLDIAPPSSDRGETESPPPSTSRVFESSSRSTEKNTRATMRKPMPSMHDESTRVVQGDALAAITRPPPALANSDEDVEERNHTHAWADVDEALLRVGEEEGAPPPPSRSGNQATDSGVASRGARVAAMRELYASGDADGAMALAATLSESEPPGAAYDSPDASIVVEFSEQSIDLSDPFGGLIPLDDDPPAEAVTAPPPGRAASAPPPPAAAAASLSLTERQSIPRLIKSMGDVSKLKIDHRAGFLLAHVDGMQTLEEILDICAMPGTEALELIAKLKQMGVIEFE